MKKAKHELDATKYELSKTRIQSEDTYLKLFKSKQELKQLKYQQEFEFEMIKQQL